MKKFFCIILFVIVFSTVSFAGVDVPEYIRVKLSDGTIEEVELDTYLYSVVQSEMGVSYKASGMSKSEAVPIDALKAQAVASRSYAVYNINKAGEDAEFHVTASTSSQVYNHNVNINANVKKAVDETSGQVITYDDEVACAYFFSTSGGQTESSENVWYSEVPYLKAVEDKYEIEVDNKSSWTAVYSISDIENKFPEIGDFKSIKILEYSDNDRVIELKIKGTDGSKILTKNSIRTALGATKLKSQWFDVEVDEDEIIFTGRGYGHGVGMSQNGAIGMALNGFSYDEILKWYYTDIEILGIENSRNDINKYPEQHIEIDKREKERPLLNKLVNACSTNWLLEGLK